MEKNEIMIRIQEIFRDILDNNEIQLSMTSTSDNVDEWDSLSNIQILSAIQKEFSIKLYARETMCWENVGDMVNSVYSKLNHEI